MFCICGEAHAARAETALRILRRFSRSDVVLVVARSGYLPKHDQVLNVGVPADLSDHQASIYLKTMLPQLVGDGSATCCYLDSDQIATSSRVDDVFASYRPPVTFAADDSTIDRFSRYAVRCSCRAGPCTHLRAAIRRTFGIELPDGEQRLWNGGLYLFDRRSLEFSRAWHANTVLTFDDPCWRVRDQGTLMVTRWQLGLQSHPTFPPAATRIVDRFYGYREAQRPALTPAEFFVDRGYRLGDDDGPAFLHFINGGVGCAGWPNWDEVEAWVHA